MLSLFFVKSGPAFFGISSNKKDSCIIKKPNEAYFLHNQKLIKVYHFLCQMSQPYIPPIVQP